MAATMGTAITAISSALAMALPVICAAITVEFNTPALNVELVQHCKFVTELLIPLILVFFPSRLWCYACRCDIEAYANTGLLFWITQSPYRKSTNFIGINSIILSHNFSSWWKLVRNSAIKSKNFTNHLWLPTIDWLAHRKSSLIIDLCFY